MAESYGGTSYDAATKRDRYLQLRSALLSERTSFDAHWKELGDWMQPRRTRFWTGDRNKGDKRNQNIIDSTGRFAARTLQSGLHAGLTSPARPWMKLTTPDPDLAKQGDVNVWLHDVTQRMLTIFATSNLYNVLPTIYGDLGVFGTAAMCVVEDELDVFRCEAYPIGSYYGALDARQRVGTFIRDYQLTVRQLVEMFGGDEGRPRGKGQPINWATISSAVRSLWVNRQYSQAVDVCWVVMPNEDADEGRLGAKYLPISSCYFEIGASIDSDGSLPSGFLRESGYREFPIMMPRWEVTGGDTYGTDCPGMTALGDVKQLQIMQKDKGRAIKKMIDPPLSGPNVLRTQKTSLLPGDVTYADMREGAARLQPIHEVRLDLDHLLQDMGQVQYRIQRAFFEDLFLMLAQSDAQRGSQPITAREVDERHEEKLLVLGPVLERTNDELLDPLVDRVYGIMSRAGLIPPAPESLHGVKLKVQYTSILAQAQKLVGVSGQDRLMQTIVPLAQVWPEIREKIDPLQLVDNYVDMLGVDPRLVRSNDDANARVAKIQQAQQAAQDADNAAKMGKAAQAAAAAPMDGDTALTRIVGNVTGAGAGGAALGGGG